MKNIILAAAILSSPAPAAHKPTPEEAIDAFGTILAIEEVAAATCPKLVINQAAHAHYLDVINPPDDMIIDDSDNKEIDAAIAKSSATLRADIAEFGKINWCAGVVHVYGPNGTTPLFEVRP
jgi:predicted RNA-binding Zn ribbon-like protein